MVSIIGEIKFGNLLINHQLAKLKSLSNFPAIQQAFLLLLTLEQSSSTVSEKGHSPSRPHVVHHVAIITRGVAKLKYPEQEYGN